MRIFPRDDLFETHSPVGLITQGHRACDDADGTGEARRKLANQRSRHPAGGDIILADTVQPTGGGNIGYKGNDADPFRISASIASRTAKVSMATTATPMQIFGLI